MWDWYNDLEYRDVMVVSYGSEGTDVKAYKNKYYFE
jgi:hypothetical protein